ncbi:MAG: universal stress protein, partial [Cyanobacteria bacterium P01_E01_bin.34]
QLPPPAATSKVRQLLRHMLVAVDASYESVTQAKALLSAPNAGVSSITLLHVIPTTQFSSSAKGNEKKVEARTILNTAKEAFEDVLNCAISERLEEGDPKTTVLKVADEVDASLIVMGGRGMNRLMAILKNSVSQYVFQLSTRPMVIVRQGMLTSKLYRVMVAIDGSEASNQALRIGMDLLRGASGSQLLLARVVSGRSAASYQQLPENPDKDDDVLAAAIAQVKAQNIPYRAYFNLGDPGREIALLTGETGADLLVMGSPDRRPSIAKNLPDLERLLGNSVSDYVRVNAQCPVLLTRPQG